MVASSRGITFKDLHAALVSGKYKQLERNPNTIRWTQLRSEDGKKHTLIGIAAELYSEKNNLPSYWNDKGQFGYCPAIVGPWGPSLTEDQIPYFFKEENMMPYVNLDEEFIKFFNLKYNRRLSQNTTIWVLERAGLTFEELADVLESKFGKVQCKKILREEYAKKHQELLEEKKKK